VDALKIKLSPAETKRIGEVPTRNMEAHDLYLQGREALLSNENTREMFERAIHCFTRAIELDPDYAGPYAGLAHAYNRDFQNNWIGLPDSKELSAHFSKLALEKGPDLPYAHYIAALVKFWDRDLAGSVAAMERALALSPNFSLAIGLRGMTRIYDGVPLEGIPDLEHALRLDPLMGHLFWHFIGSAYLVAGQFDKAVESFGERIRRTPNTDLTRGLLISALGHLGRTEEAGRVWTELKRINPRYSFDAHISRLPFRDPADAERIRHGFAKAGLAE
jgi:adenylate cyclase